MGEKQKNNVIKKQDIERYEILLPFSALSGKRKKKFLCSELEKMHPCFSDEFAYDCSLRGVRKGGFCEDVFVINKFKLAEYEGSRQFSGSGLFIEDKNYHRFFIDKKWKGIFWGILGCLIVGLAGSLSGVLAARAAKNGLQTLNTQKEFLRGDSEMFSGVEASNILTCPIEISFFEKIEKAGGKISLFEWKIDGVTQRLNASVQGIYPETFSDSDNEASVGPVIYINGNPKMNVSYERRLIQAVSKLQQNISLIEAAEFYKNVRKTLSETGAILREEKISPYHIEFICGKDSEKEKLFSTLSQIISISKHSVTSLSIQSSGLNELSIGLSVERIPILNSGFDLKLIAQYVSLFSEDEIKSGVRQSEIKRAASGTKRENQIIRQKIGEIKKSDNTKIVFYKNAEGKMEVER